MQSRKEHYPDLGNPDDNDDSSVASGPENWLSTWKDSWVLVSEEAKVQRKDIERLGEGEWLGDEIINSCTEAITREANPKVFMMGSLKFASVEKAIPTGRLRLGKFHTRLAKSRYFVVPVHQGGNHWSMGIIISDDRDTPQATVLTVDSLDTYGNKANRGISRSLKSLLRLERGEGYPVHWLHAKNIQQ
jgi:Ulp1 family protease